MPATSDRWIPRGWLVPSGPARPGCGRDGTGARPAGCGRALGPVPLAFFGEDDNGLIDDVTFVEPRLILRVQE
jgi:hypothetical protein